MVKVNLVIVALLSRSAEMAVRRTAKVVAVDKLRKQAHGRPIDLSSQ